MLKVLSALIAVSMLTWAAVTSARAEPCEAKTFDAAIDGAGASLRFYNASAQPKLRERVKELMAKRGKSGEAGEEEMIGELSDDRVVAFDMKANDLLAKIDQLGRPAADGTYDCSKLSELEATSVELLSVMKSKFAYLDDKLDKELGTAKVVTAPGPTTAPAPAPATPKPPDTVTAEPKAAAPAKPSPEVKAAAKPVPVPAPLPRPENRATWDTTTANAPPPEPGYPTVKSPSDAYSPSAAARDGLVAQGPAAGLPGEPYALPPVEFESTEEGYTIEEIQAATTGFFGSISTGLAGVIEHAFSSAGRPTAYILGKEGGGAFLAGLRYGNGTLYLRQGGTRPIFWHGPSVGYDVGAEGGRTLILVYKLKNPDAIYRRFTGVDGSAYLVGGVGMTLLKGGDVIMAPIRSGVGVRLGANIGYIRFTDQPTWNPF